jgi:hypothetical protein
MVQRGSLQILLKIRSRKAALPVRSTVVVQVGDKKVCYEAYTCSSVG